MKIRKLHSLNRAALFLAICSLAAGAMALAGAWALPQSSAQSRSGFQYNGITQVSWWFDEYDSAAGGTSRAALRDTSANWMGLLVTWYQQDASSNVIARNPDPNKDHSDARIRAAIQDAHSRGLQVMLKPHVDALNGQWRGDFNPGNPAAWFQSYTQFIVHYAQIAQEEGVELFCMGTEFKTISGAANRDRWVAVINAIRTAYNGPLTYAANATFPADEFTSVSFWDQLDIMGLDGYFTLTNQNNPTPAQLVSAWTSNSNGENIVAAVQNFANSRQKPVIFTEIGYKSTDGANREPWNFGLSGALDTAEQRDCYEAAFTVWSQQSSWMRGFFWWAWTVPPPPANDGDYNPRSKPAETVLRSWQGGVANPNFALSANPSSLTVNRGASGVSAITITRGGGFTSGVTLSATGLPSGVAATFNPASTTGGSSAVTLAVSSAAPTGMFNVTINGTGGGLSRSTTLSLTIGAAPTPDFTLSASPSNLTVNRGASGTSTIAITRSGGFTGAVTVSASGLPSGVTATFNPASTTGGSVALTLAASSAAPTGITSVTLNGAGGGLTRSTTLILTVNGDAGTGGVTVTPLVTASGPWFNEVAIRLNNTASLTALSVTITVQRTTGIGFGGQYNTIGGQILQSNTVAAATITYQYSLAPGQTLGAGANRLFAAQFSGSGTIHPTTGDTYTVTYTTGGVSFTQTGHF
jgi:phosphoheptose isomerase